MSFGVTIKKLRQQANLTQEQLANLLSISPQAISRWENGAAMPDISLLVPLANLFHVSTDHLLGIEEETEEDVIRDLIDKAALFHKSP
ncbi:MAG: helix-turn-helix transcriptional regulator [Christensenellaceae bacterium]|nr:helix-turn-helix transcriptional regulator [Christensenellaceae bacterium]